MPGSVLVVSRTALGRLEPLGKGGTATVYSALEFPLPGVGVVVYKEYKQSIRAHAGPSLLPGLQSLVRFRHDRLADPQRERWDERIVWPLRVVTNEANGATGILMRRIPQRYFQTVHGRSGRTSIRPREVETLFGSPADMTRIGLPVVDIRDRIGLVGQIVATYAMMHRAGIVLGDISGRNIVYDPAGPRPNVLVIDADSARVEGTRSAFTNQPHTPHWEPPEALNAARALRSARRPGSTTDTGRIDRLSASTVVQSRATDVYKFGLLVVRILDHGRQRSVNRDPATAERVLRRAFGNDAAELLRRTLDPDPMRRPDLREWYDLMHPRRQPVVTPEPVPTPAVSDGQVSGSWVFVEGTGWTRKSAGG